MTPTMSFFLLLSVWGCIARSCVRKITNTVNLDHTHVSRRAIYETGLDREDLERNTLGRDRQLELIVAIVPSSPSLTQQHHCHGLPNPTITRYNPLD